jgi:hypothetical protein
MIPPAERQRKLSIPWGAERRRATARRGRKEGAALIPIADVSAPSIDGNRISHSVTNGKAHNCRNQELDHGPAPLFE